MHLYVMEWILMAVLLTHSPQSVPVRRMGWHVNASNSAGSEGSFVYMFHLYVSATCWAASAQYPATTLAAVVLLKSMVRHERNRILDEFLSSLHATLLPKGSQLSVPHTHPWPSSTNPTGQEGFCRKARRNMRDKSNNR